MTNPLKPVAKLFDVGKGANPVKVVTQIYDPVARKFVAAAIPTTLTVEQKAAKQKANKGTGEKRGEYRKKKTIGTGTIFGKLIVRRKLRPKKDVIPNLRIQFRCECTAVNFEGKRCGNSIDVPRYYLLRKSNPKQDCGCTIQTLASKYKREKQVWQMMNFRTQDARHVAFKHYQKNGITVTPEWRRDCEDGLGFERFFAHVGPCPTPQHSLDRIRNKEGYKPGNVTWATATSQRANQGDRIGGKTLEEIQAMGLTEEEWVDRILADDKY